MGVTDRVLVTGGAGFIGSHIADGYLGRGYEVVVLDDLSTGRRENVPSGAEFVHASVTDPAARDLVASGGFAIVNHHAAQMDVRRSVEDPLFDERVNIGGLLNLLEGARAGGVRRVVFASSGGVVYGELDGRPHGEGAPKRPLSPYGVSKLASEYYLSTYAALHGLEVVALRYANVYGPRQNPHGEAGVVAIFCRKLCAGDQPLIFGDGEQTRDYVFVGDVVRANLALSAGDVPVGVDIDTAAYNVGTGIETSVNTLAQILIDASGAATTIRHAEARAGELLRSAVDPAKLMRAREWTPQTKLEDGLRRTYEWISEQ